jgi:hypothetical protein
VVKLLILRRSSARLHKSYKVSGLPDCILPDYTNNSTRRPMRTDHLPQCLEECRDQALAATPLRHRPRLAPSRRPHPSTSTLVRYVSGLWPPVYQWRLFDMQCGATKGAHACGRRRRRHSIHPSIHPSDSDPVHGLQPTFIHTKVGISVEESRGPSPSCSTLEVRCMVRAMPLRCTELNAGIVLAKTDGHWNPAVADI